MKFRVFTNDVGPDQYSALRDIVAPNLESALKQSAAGLEKGTKILCIPHAAAELWPHGISGRVPSAALKFRAVVG